MAVHAGKRHGKGGSVFIAMMQADHAIVTMRATDHLGSIGHDVARNEGSSSTLVALSDVIAHRTDSKGESDHARFFTALADELGQLVSAQIAEIPI